MRDIKVDFIDLDSTLVREQNIILRALHKLYGDYVQLTENNPDLIFYGDGTKRFKDFDCVRVYVPQENKMPNFRECNYALSYLEIKDPRNLRLPFYVHHCPATELIKQDNEFKQVNLSKKKFCSFVVSNANSKRTSKRIEFFKKLSQYKPVDSGGLLFNNVGGPIANKRDFLSNYKFNIAFENRAYPGYTSEKLTDAMRARCLPIYWGNPDIDRDFNPKSFINISDFNNMDSAIQYIIDLDQDDEKYSQVMNEPYLPGNKPSQWYNEERIMPFLDKIFTDLKPKRSFFFLNHILFNLQKNLEPYITPNT